MDYAANFAKTGDTYGTIHPDYSEDKPRFRILVTGHEPEEEKGWRYKLLFIDYKYQDSEGFPVDAVCAGDSWDEAFALAGKWVTKALNTDHCIF